MIEFAKTTHPGQSGHPIQYIQQDFGVDFERTDERIKALEGKVSLVFSNMALHWVNKLNDKQVI